MFIISPLLGHSFSFGRRDCFSLSRDFYKLNFGLEVPNFARPSGRWDETDNLFLRLFQKCGFTLVPVAEAIPGDVLLTCFRSPTVNHAVILLDHGLVLHHLWGRHSETSDSPIYSGHASMALRHPQATLMGLPPHQRQIVSSLPIADRARFFQCS
jgi:cell wall-associated NlpC family hydrolase